MNKNKWFLNGGRGSGQTYRRLFEYYENKVADLEAENAGLKADNDARKFAMTMSEKVEKQLREENAELRNNGFTVSAMTEQQLKVALEKGEQLEKENAELKLKLEALDGQTPWKDIKDKSEVIGKLAQAKELLAKWVELFKPKGGNIPPTPIQVDTEQFLKESE